MANSAKPSDVMKQLKITPRLKLSGVQGLKLE